MGTTYVQPTQSEMETTLKAGEVFWQAPQRGGEIVYDWPVRKGVAVRVCSSIVPGVGGRAVGEDAIRVLVIHTASDKVFWQTTRVHRTKNWSKNMMVRVREAWEYIRALSLCEMCGTPLYQAVSKAGNPYKKCVDSTCVSKTDKPFRRGV